MRLTAKIKQPNSEVKRLMIFDSEDGVYLFVYNTHEDSSALCDYWFEKIDDAFESCSEDYGITKQDWNEIPNPLEHCQHDWIEPVRIKGRDNGNPQWGKLEKFINGKWIDL